ncbi:EthD domain-containing protein [Pseudofrankia inefficax]|uniref:Ethyl tert-butyl ether degradation EthD n=1 Tax=Pseudofrankia inefficax (strain DSM 45817 / CECT 9037 / DDB 130130 / EuI1c) TaxID=298654 RepID=E3J9G8_PSEI1|nr:EthD domain-containing protein [Pseudofrankia inefficax]ADP83332.1 Ethyl tert-butyl ether degradation EthD [Pseudofrankia inefficax]
MIKIVALIKRRPDLTREQFRDYYEHRHAPLFHRVIPDEVATAIVHYVQNHAVTLGRGSTDTLYDCVTEIGFVDRDQLAVWNRWYLGDDGKVLRDDEENFMDKDKRIVIVADVCDIGIVR